MDIRNWYQPTPTTHEVYEGIYPSVILNCVAEQTKDKEGNARQTVRVTFETLQEIGTVADRNIKEKIVFEAQFHFNVQIHRNGLNRLAHACGMKEFRNTEDFEAKTLMAGVINNKYTNNNGEEKTVAQAGYGCFSFAPLPREGAKPEFILTDYQAPTDEDRKKWFPEKIKQYFPTR